MRNAAPVWSFADGYDAFCIDANIHLPGVAHFSLGQLSKDPPTIRADPLPIMVHPKTLSRPEPRRHPSKNCKTRPPPPNSLIYKRCFVPLLFLYIIPFLVPTQPPPASLPALPNSAPHPPQLTLFQPPVSLSPLRLCLSLSPSSCLFPAYFYLSHDSLRLQKLQLRPRPVSPRSGHWVVRLPWLPSVPGAGNSWVRGSYSVTKACFVLQCCVRRWPYARV